ncbi:hypothetical protein HC928_07065 [bacterium]|nr:hypothetical protein [bacterium]
MSHLWQHRGHLVRYEDLERAVYGDTAQGTAIGTLKKLVDRLRNDLQRDKKTSRDYINVRDGTGYILQNWREQL